MTGIVLLNCDMVTYHNISNTDTIKAMGEISLYFVSCFQEGHFLKDHPWSCAVLLSRWQS